jgi:hypothetical protein
MEGVVNTEFSAALAVEADLSDKPTGATGSAMMAGIKPQRATKAINARIICLMAFALAFRCP